MNEAEHCRLAPPAWYRDPWIEFDAAHALRLAKEGPTPDELHRAWVRYVAEQAKEGGTP
jgi:hypothetical protein